MADIRLIYSGSYCGSRTGQRGRAERRRDSKKRDSSGAPARRSLYKFHESFEPYIFSLSSRFARHVLLKYDNFTRAGRPPPSPPSPPPLRGLRAFLFFFHGPPRGSPLRSSSAFVYSGPGPSWPDGRFPRTRVVTFFTSSIYHPRYNCMLIPLITCEILSHRR